MGRCLRRLFVLACVLVVLIGLGQSVALASPTPTGPVQPSLPPLGGVTYTTSGDIASGSGLIYTFSGLSPTLMAQFQDLEWGPADGTAVQLSMDGNAGFIEPGQTLTFDAGQSILGGGMARWTGASQYPIEQPQQTLSLLTRFTMQASPPLNATAGYGDGATTTVLGNFSVTLLFEVSADGGVTWTPAKDFFNQHQNFASNSIQSSFLGGFFYTLKAVPVAMVSPASPFSFGNQLVGQTSAAAIFTVQNTGNADLHVQTATVSGTGYAISSDTCSGQTVTAGNTCTVGVTFTPTQTGPQPGMLTFTDDAADSPQQISLTGTGTQPAVSLMPTSLTFNGQAVNTTSSAQTITVTNTGTADLHVSSVFTTGGDFSAAPSGCSDVTPGGTCTISVTFTPTTAGARTSTLNIVSDAPSNPSVSLSGTGLNSHLALSPSPMSFGDVLFGQSKTLTLTFSNSGTDPTHITGFTPTGPNQGDFTLLPLTLTCQGGPPVVPAGLSCSVNITFTPGAVGARSASLTFPNDSSDGPQTVALTGNGTNPGISVAPATLTFPSQGIGTTSSAQPVVVTSSGTSALTVSSVTASGPFRVSSDGCSSVGPIAPPNTCTVQVVFMPTASGAASGALTITSDGGTKTVALSGAGVAVADLGISIGATPNPIKNNSKTTLTYTVTLKNAGPNAASGIAISDSLPSFEQFKSLAQVPSGLTCSTPGVGASGTVVCSMSALSAGASIQFQILVSVVAPKKGTVTNTVTVSSQSYDPVSANNQASASTVVQ